MADEGNDNALIQMGGGKTFKGRVRKIQARTEKPTVHRVQLNDSQVYTDDELNYFYYVEGMTQEMLNENP